MGRPQVVLREATASDADFLAGLWASSLRRVEPEAQVADLLTIIERAHEAPEQRLIVADYEDRPAGAVLLHLVTVSALNLEPTVRVLSPSVVPDLRRHGVGHALLEAALCFADEHGISTLGTAVNPAARDSNRFMARLGFSALATYRIAPTAAVRARLRGQRPTAVVAGVNGRAATRVIAARRSMRRSRAAG